jgi:hypothetical protein
MSDIFETSLAKRENKKKLITRQKCVSAFFFNTHRMYLSSGLTYEIKLTLKENRLMLFHEFFADLIIKRD